MGLLPAVTDGPDLDDLAVAADHIRRLLRVSNKHWLAAVQAGAELGELNSANLRARRANGEADPIARIFALVLALVLDDPDVEGAAALARRGPAVSPEPESSLGLVLVPHLAVDIAADALLLAHATVRTDAATHRAALLAAFAVVAPLRRRRDLARDGPARSELKATLVLLHKATARRGARRLRGSGELVEASRDHRRGGEGGRDQCREQKDDELHGGRVRWAGGIQ